MSNDFERVKQSLDLESVITQETGLHLKRHHLEACPFCGGHECFSIKSDRGNYHCYQCSEGGDIFSFLETYHKLDKYSALERAAQIAGIKLLRKKNTGGLELTVGETMLLEAAKHYHANLPSNGGWDYFTKQRGHEEHSLKNMLVGWSTGNLVDYLRSKGYSDPKIIASGLGSEKEFDGKNVLLDFFGKGLAIFPHWERGKVLHFTMKDPEKKQAYQLPANKRSSAWRFYNQDAIRKFSELILVEGENDTLSMLDAQIPHVIGLIGQPADYQIKALKTYCAKKHIYLWLDNDNPGKEYVRKISNALAGTAGNLRIIDHGERYNDPDEYLRAFKGNRRAEVKRLQTEALSYVAWEIQEIAKLENLGKKLEALKSRKVFSAVAEMVEAEKLVFIEKIMDTGFTREAVCEQLEANLELKQQIRSYFQTTPPRDCDPNFVAGMIFDYFSQHGRFFCDRENKAYLLHRHYIYEIGTNLPFNALMKKMTELLYTKEPGRSVWDSLKSEAYNRGQKIDLASWIDIDQTDSIYINLNLPNNQILKVSKDGIEEIPNGINNNSILLKSSPKILPLNFLPDISISEGMKALKELVFDNLTCEAEQRYLILCWLFSAFLLDFLPYMGLLKFGGATESGKTTAAKLLSIIIYGEEHLGDPSTAAAYAVSSQNPLLIIDNLENADVTKSILKFMLLTASKGAKEKRVQGTNSDTLEEKPKSLLLITAIEPFTKAELINRTFDIEFSKAFRSIDFIEGETKRELVKKRDVILSAILKFIHKDILPNFHKQKDYITVLKKEHRNHAKSRMDEYLALLMLMLEKLVRYIPFSTPDDFYFGGQTEDKEIRTAWIEYQNNKARETETTSNHILKLLDGLAREYLSKMGNVVLSPHRNYSEEVFYFTHPEYLIEVFKTQASVITADDGEQYTQAYFEFIATSADIVAAFDRFCRNNGIKNPYESAAVFSSRLRNDIPLLKKGGWELISRPGLEPYFTKIHGQRFWKFRKLLIK